jgi:hypothetical protein
MANPFVTLLDKLGSDFKLGAEKALAVEAKLLPAEQAVAQVLSVVDPPVGVTLEGLLTSVVGVQQVATALKVGTGNGAQLLAVAIPGLEQAILSDPLFKGKTPANLPLWNSAIEKITGALADVLNSFEAAPAAPAPAAPAA